MANCEVLSVFRKPETVKFKITDGDLPNILGKGNLHFFLVAKGKGIHKETQVLLDMRSGTVFIQTDKPIYSPKEKVKYRVIPVGPDFLPMKQQVMVEIVNPQGIRVSRERNIEAWKRGFATKEFVLGDIPVHGTWTITAYFSNKNVANSSTTFLVKEYVLPTFLVRVMPPSYIAETDKTISIKVTAKYSYGKNVLGNIRLRLSIIDGERKEIIIDDQRTMISGEEVFLISADKLLAPKEIPSFPIGSKLKIFAAVTERATGTKESATDISTVLVKSPYTISFTNTAKYFRPALSFRVQVSVRFPNKKPAKDVKLRFSATNSERPLAMGESSSNLANTNERGEAFFTLNTPKDIVDATRINVLVKTEMNTVENSEAKLTLEPYISAKKNYIVVRPPVVVPKIGSRTSIKVLIPFHGEINQLNYLVSARGRIVDQGTVQRNVGVETSFPLSITADMAPKCRIVVYFERQGEIAADSALMDIEDGFNNKIKIEPRKIDDRETDETAFRPALDFVLRVENQKQSLVGIVGVDQSVYYLRNKSRITHEKVFKDIGNFDLGCGVGSGKDNGDVFHTAGLFALSSTPLLTKKRNTVICPEYNPSRKRRSVANKAPALIGKCCKGRCCGAGLLRGRTIGGVIDWIPSPDEIDNDETQVTIRQSFPETWIWKDQLTGDADKTELRFTIPDTITTWEVSALSINNDNGFGLSNVLHLQSTRNVFIHVKMPYSAQRREQITVYAVVYNYYEVKTRANIFLKGHSTFCSVAKPGERSSRISVVIDPKSAIAIPFVIIPLTIGTIPIEFQAFTTDMSDRIIKELLVVPEGVPKESVHSITLDPQGRLESKNKKEENTKVKGRKGNQLNTYDLKIPEDFVKDSQLVKVYVTGNMMGAAVEDIIKGGLNNLVRLPTGCGEQTMIRMAPTVYVLRYLTSIKNGVTSEIEKKAYSFMRSGYNHELKWRRTDNSYSVWGQRTPASTWLTAFVNKVFCQAREFIKDDIDENIVCDSLKFLESIQEPDGSFPEGYAVRHREMIIQQSGDTACETKALHTLHDTVIISKGRSFLESQMPQITSGYLMSLVAYSLSIANSPVKNAAYNKLAGMLIQDTSEDRDAMYIKDGGPALCVEATSYALLTMMSLKETDAAGPLVVWLTKQRNAKGSFYSTQDTVVALQALSEYSSKTAGGELDLTVTVTSAKDADIVRSFRVKAENALVRQQTDITGALPGRVFIDTKGKGTAQLQIVTTYNQPSSKNERCGYVIKVKTNEGINNLVSDAPDGAKLKPLKKKKSKKCKKRKGKKGRRRRKCKKNKKTKRNQQKDQVANEITVDVCATHKFANGSSMTIVDVGLLTGFKPDQKSLKALLSKDQNPRIDHYEENDRSVVFYLGKISNTKKTCITFVTKRVFSVGDLLPVPVKVYDYYEPSDSCTVFYGPKANSQLLGTICDDDDECQCSQGTCADEPTTNAIVLKKKACLDADFVFTGVIKAIEDQNSWERVAVRVEKIHKKGKFDYSVGGKLHVYKTKACVYPELKVNKKYLIMLKDGIKYVIDKEAFILAWPDHSKKKQKLRNALSEVQQGDVCDKL
eukprot:gene16274-17915_t